MIVGNLVVGKRIVQVFGREFVYLEDSDQVWKFLFLVDVLQWCVYIIFDYLLFLLLNVKGIVISIVICVQLYKRVERVVVVLMEKGRLSVGDYVVLVYLLGVDFIVVFYGCLYCGCVFVIVWFLYFQNFGIMLFIVKMIVEVSKFVCVFIMQVVIWLFRFKEVVVVVDIRIWFIILDKMIF